MAEGETRDLNFESLPCEARRLILGEPNFEYQLSEYFQSNRKDMTILLSGKTGVGKSHLTNALIGQVLAREGDGLEAQTNEVTDYKFTKNGVKITVFDTPGLADGTENEEEYLEKIKEKVTVFDTFIFCTEMNTTRFRNDDIKTVQKLTEAFGSQLWEHAVVVLTFANEVHPPLSRAEMNAQDFFDERLRLFKKKIKDVLINVKVPEEIVLNVPFVAAGDLHEPRLPGIPNWITALWIATLRRLNRSAKPAFILANITRFNYVRSFEEERRMRRPPLRRSLSPSYLRGGDQIQRKMHRKSFQGFEQVHRDHDETNRNANTAANRRPFTRSHSMAETTTPLELPNLQINQGNDHGQGDPGAVPSIDLDTPSFNEILAEILIEYGREAVREVGERILSGSGIVISVLFNWLVNYVKALLQNTSERETGASTEGEEEMAQEEN